MNRLKFLLAAFLVAVVTLGIYSCAKEENDLTSGKNTETRSNDVTEGTVMPTLRLAPSVVSGILKFNSKQHLSEFWEDIENADEDQLNLMEQTLGFVSKRTNYANTDLGTFNGTSIVGTSSSFLIDNPFDAVVFNQHHELWVGNDIYKLVGKRLVVKANSAYVSEILSMRNNTGMVRENTELIDMNTKETLPEPPVSNRTKCTMAVVTVHRPEAVDGGNLTRFYIRPLIINTNGNQVSVCGGNVSINWGDGTTSNHSNTDIGGIRYHNFNVGPGECKSFKVKITVDLTLCGECTGTIFTEQNITVCSPISCTEHEGSRDETTVFLMAYSNNTRLAEFRMGYNLDNFFWHDARAWGRIRHFSLNAQGGITGLVNPGFATRVRIHGAVFVESCTGTRVGVEKSQRKRTSDLKVMFKRDGNNLRLRSDDDLFADFEVFGTSNTVPDVSLSNRPFSTL